MNATEFSKRNSWYCPDMFRITFKFFSYRKKPIMVNLHFGVSFIGKMAAILDLTAILHFLNVYKLVSYVMHKLKSIHLVHLVIKYLWKRLICLRFCLKMAVILNNALNITRKPFFFYFKNSLRCCLVITKLITCQDRYN